MQTTRPVFLTLWQIKMPLTAIVSILHRISGIAMVVSIPVAAYLFHLALASQDGYTTALAVYDSWYIWPLRMFVFWGLLHHLIAGIRHLFMDYDFWLEREQSRLTAKVTLTTAASLLIILLALGALI